MRLGYAAGAALALVLGPSTPPVPAPVSRPGTDAPPAGLTRDDWSQIRRSVQASQYHARRVARAGHAPSLQAPNRRQAYRTTFRPDGIRIVPAGKAASWRLGVSVTGYGYEGDVRHVEPVVPQAEEERVEYRRGRLTEWYVNRPAGLEQGFELLEPDPRRAGPLVVLMRIDSDLDPSQSGDGVSFARSGQPLVRYAGLAAWDAGGRPLRSRLEAGDREIRLVVEAQAARFPVTVDPTFVHEAQLFGHGDPLGQAGASLGRAVSVSVDTVVVGAPDEEDGLLDTVGAAHVFVRTGTTWTEQQELMPADGQDGDHFGASVSLSGDTAVVGAPLADTAGGFNAGAAYVFVRSGTVWTQQQKLVPSDGDEFDQFGFSASVSGDTVVAGAYVAGTAAGANAGKAYAFVRSGTTWSEQQTLLAPDGAVLDYFGFSVSVWGDTALVGAVNGDAPGVANTGSAYAFVRSGTTWSAQQELLAPDGAAGDALGFSVSLSGDTALVGARGDDTAGALSVGSAYVFVRSGTTWAQQQKLVASDGEEDDRFGTSVSVAGDTAVVGVPGDDSGTPSGEDAGSAYVFARSGTTWTEQQTIRASDGVAFDTFGVAVAVLGDTAVVGASGDDTVVGLDTGAAYVFVRSATWGQQQKLLGLDGSAHGVGDTFGNAVSVSGDTAVVGAYQDDTAAGVDAGSAYVFARSGTVWSLQQKLMAPDGAPTDFFGFAVSVSGDTLIVGSTLDDNPSGVDAGSAYVFARSGTTWTLQQKLLASDGSGGDIFGCAVAVAGDTLVVGARGDDPAATGNAGSAYVFVRSGVTWSEQQKLVASDPGAFDMFGTSVALSGDTAVVGANLDDAPASDAGSAYVFVRSGVTWSEQQKLVASDGAAADEFGFSVAIAGETAVVGAARDDTPAGANAGSAYVFARSGTTWTEQQRLVPSDGAADDRFGFAVAVSGDAAVVGAEQDDSPASNAGSAYVFARSGTAWNQHEKLLAPDADFADRFGSAVGVDGDTVVIGAPSDDTAAGFLAGSVHVFRGNVPVELQSFTVE